MLRKISEEACWEEGNGRRSEPVGQIDPRGGSYGSCRDPEAHTHRHEWFVQRVCYRDLILNAHTSFRWKRIEASGPATGRQHGRREMLVINPVASGCGVPDAFAGDRLRETLRSWVTAPDPSTNHNIACGIKHDGTAQWFFRGRIFSEWKSTGSLLWIYGKRNFSLLVPDPLLMIIRILSGLWEEHPLVSHPSVLYSKTNLRCFAVLQSFKTSKLCARQD